MFLGNRVKVCTGGYTGSKLYVVEKIDDKFDDKNNKSPGDDFRPKIMPEMESGRYSDWKNVLS